METVGALKTHLNVAGRACKELNADKGTGFTSAGVQRFMQQNGVNRRFKFATRNLNIADWRAMGLLRDRIAVIATEANDSWFDAHQTAANARQSLAKVKPLLGTRPRTLRVALGECN